VKAKWQTTNEKQNQAGVDHPGLAAGSWFAEPLPELDESTQRLVVLEWPGMRGDLEKSVLEYHSPRADPSLDFNDESIVCHFISMLCCKPDQVVMRGITFMGDRGRENPSARTQDALGTQKK